jgi:uncharacterized repeat protein (TIGR01451 family)
MKTAYLMRTVFGVALCAAMVLPFSAAHEVAHGLDGIRAPDDDCLPKYPPPPVVKIKVRVAACSEPGRNIEYRICVENCAPAEAHHVMVKNALPANAKFVKAEPEPTKQGPELQWSLGTIGGGAVREIVLVLQPTNREEVKNCARVQFEHGQCVVTRQTAYPPGARPPIISTIPDVPKGDEMPMLELSIRGPKENYANLPIKYEITLTNKGKGKATNVLVSTRLPKDLKPSKASEPGVIAENRIAWLLGHLDPGASRVMELTIRATEKGEHCFRVEAEADHGVRADKDICTKFVGVSAMTIEMIGKDGVVFIGHKTSYPVVIRNQASEPLTNVRLRAFVPDALKVERANAAFDAHDPVKGGQWIEFKPLPKIDGGAQARYEIFVEALKAGVTRFHIEVLADQLESGPVVEQEITNIVDDREKVKIKELSRTKGQ